MTRIDTPGRRPLLILLAAAVASSATAVIASEYFDLAVGLPIATLAWWLALACVAVAMAGRPDTATADSPVARFSGGAALVGLHGCLSAALVALPLHVWLQRASLSATLALAAAIAMAIIIPWRVWPSLALVAPGHTGDGDPSRSAGWHIRRALRGARVLTGRPDAFPDRGLLILSLHVALLMFPATALLVPASSLAWRALASVAMLVLAALVYRFWMASGESLRQRISRSLAEPATNEPAEEPIPANALLRSAALRAALRAGSVERALAILDAGVDPMAPALPDELDQRNALTIAATLNDSRPMRAMIAAGADVNHRSHGITPLLAATRDSYYGRAETVLVLLANGADTVALDDQGRSALHHAALSAEPAVAAMLLDAGTPIDAVDREGHTPLTLACSVNNGAVVTLLLDRRAAVTAGRVPALCAAADSPQDSTDVVARLLRAKAAVDAVDGDGRTPLHRAVLSGHPAIAGALIAAGATVDARDDGGRTPLHLACQAHDADSAVVAVLWSAGADADAADASGTTPRQLLAQRGAQPSPGDNPDSADAGGIDELLAAGRQSAVQAWLKGATPSQRAEMALAAAMQGIERSILDALSTPLPVDACLPGGRPLVDAAIDHWPASRSLLRLLPAAGVSVAGGARLARLLAAPGGDTDAREAIALAWLDAGADPFADAATGIGPLSHAVALGAERLVATLLDRGIDARLADRSGITALHRALAHPDELALRLSLLLLRYGADPDAATCSGETPLGLALDADRTMLLDWLRWRQWRLPGRRLAAHDLVAAASSGDSTSVRRLLVLGLDINGRDAQGCTALIRVAGNGHRALLDELIDRGADIAARAHSGSSALAAALMRGHVEIVERLLERGAQVDQRFANEATALIVAAACGSLKGIDALLVAGGDITARDAAGNTALHAAAGYAFGAPDGECARTLLLHLIAAGADVGGSNGAGLTPLHVACGAAAATRANSIGIDAALDVLLSRTQGIADIDTRGCTPLHYAAAHGQVGAVRRLLARGAEPARRDHGGWRAEDYANRYGYTEVAQALRPAPLMATMPLRPG